MDLSNYRFLPPGLTGAIACVGGYPVLSDAFETSVPGLHVLGAPAAWSFGPIMRFVSGSWYGGRAVARLAASSSRRRARGRPPQVRAAAEAAVEAGAPPG